MQTKMTRTAGSNTSKGGAQDRLKAGVLSETGQISTLDAFRSARALKAEAADRAVVQAGSGREAVKAELSTNQGLEALKSNVEVNGGKHIQYFGYAETTASGPEVEKMQKLDPFAVVGSADADGYKMEWHEPEWYLPFVEDATEISKLESLLDEPSKQWFKDVKPALDVLIKLGTYGEKDYKRNHKKDIFALVKKKGDKIFYGKSGVFNFLTAFHRIKAICPKLGGADSKGFDATKTGIETIKLMVGAKGGKIEGKDERFAYMLVRKPAIAGTAGGGAVLGPVTNDGVESPSVPSRLPDVGSDAFLKKYEIAEADKGLFDQLYGNVSVWLRGGNANLTDESFANKVEYENGEAIFFGDHPDSVNALLGDLHEFSNKFANFFEDGSNPKALEVQNLYFYAVKQKIAFFMRYEQKLAANGESLDDMDHLAEKSELRDLYGAILYLGERKRDYGIADAEVLNAMISATDAMIEREMYMGSNHLSILERDKLVYLKEIGEVAKR